MIIVNQKNQVITVEMNPSDAQMLRNILLNVDVKSMPDGPTKNLAEQLPTVLKDLISDAAIEKETEERLKGDFRIRVEKRP